MGSAKLANGSLVCFVIDLTEAKTVQANLENAKSELESSIEQLTQTQEAVIAEERLHALGQMAAGIAHDFNNCLSPIIGLSELILSRPGLVEDHDKVLKYVGTIHKAGRDAALLVSRLRDYYREAATGDEIEVVDLRRIVEDTIEFTRSRWADQAMASNVEYQIVTRLQDANVAGSPAQLRELLVNLIFNSLDAMPHGGKLTLSVDRDPARPGIVTLEVADTGVGMTPDVRKRCMEPFFTTKGAGGTGLGLATSYRIVKRHHGEIQVETELGHGTRIIVALPTISTSLSPEPPKGPAALPAMRILLIDDEEVVRNVIAEYLFADGHKVDLADGPGAGLRKIHAGSYDLIITDRAMPEMSGDQLAVQARRIAPAVPILMLTGFGDFMNAAEERPEAVDVVVSKPVTIGALRAGMTTAMSCTRELTTAS
jgi:signal transduction histidine kinase/ActR/RegA family two-component response regulator